MNLYKDKLIILTNLLNKLESKEEKLNLLNLTIKKYLCGKISPKYTKSNYPSNFNELIVNKILKDEVIVKLIDLLMKVVWVWWVEKFFCEIYRLELLVV